MKLNLDDVYHKPTDIQIELPSFELNLPKSLQTKYVICINMENMQHCGKQ